MPGKLRVHELAKEFGLDSKALLTKLQGPLNTEWRAQSKAKDADILKTLEAATAAAFFEGISAEQNRRRICGLSPTWLTLEVTKPRLGKVLHYQQFVHPQGKESVSFAAAAFYG